MNIQKKREEMVNLIDNIKDHSDRLRKSETLNLLELSVIISKVNQLHEKALILKFMSAIDQNLELEEFGIDDLHVLRDAQEEMEADIAENVVENQMESSDEDQDESVDGTEEDDEIPNADLEKEINEENQEIDIVEEQNFTETNLVEEEEPPSSLDVKSVEDEAFTMEEIEEKIELSDKPDVNEVYTEEQDTSVSARLEKHPINDLLAAIGLNERYLYANELFEGDISAFKECMQKLDAMNSYEEAQNFFVEDLKVRYSWEDENELVTALSILIERRFM